MRAPFGLLRISRNAASSHADSACLFRLPVLRSSLGVLGASASAGVLAAALDTPADTIKVRRVRRIGAVCRCSVARCSFGVLPRRHCAYCARSACAWYSYCCSVSLAEPAGERRLTALCHFLQTRLQAGQGKYKGIIDCVQKTWAEEGACRASHH
jgi:hypothetical protein